jgi:hypothetical protein
MRSVFCIYPSSTSPPTNGTSHYWTPCSNGGTSHFTSNTNARTVCSVAGSVTNLWLRCPTNTAAVGSYTLVCQVNGTDSALTVTVNLTGTSAAVQAGDTTNSAAVTVGQDICFKITSSGTPEAQASPSFGFTFDSTNAGEAPVWFKGSNGVASGAFFIAPGSSRANSTEAQEQVVWPTGGQLDQMYVKLSTAPVATSTKRFTLRQDTGGGSADTALTCDIADAGTTGNDTDAGHAVAITAGNLITIGATDAVGTPVGSIVSGCMRWRPTTDGESVLAFHQANAPSATNTTFGQLMGAQNSNTSEATGQSIAPIGFTAKKLYMSLGTAPLNNSAVSDWREVFFRQGSTAAGVTSSALTVRCINTETAGNDTTHTVAVTAGDFLSFAQVPTSSPAATTHHRESIVAFIDPGGGATPLPKHLLLMGCG